MFCDENSALANHAIATFKAEAICPVLSYIDIIKISDEEVGIMTDCGTCEEAAKELLEKGISCVIVTL